MDINNWDGFLKKTKMEKKVIMNMFICRRESPKSMDRIIDLDTGWDLLKGTLDKELGKKPVNSMMAKRVTIGSSNTNPNWSKCVEVLHSIKFPTSFGVSGASSRGLGVQALLDTNLEESASFCKGLLDKFLPEIPLIVISEVNVQIKNTPIGEWQDDDLVQPGRYFDKLVNEGKSGLVIHDENTPN
jgi:hypothetical protein